MSAVLNEATLRDKLAKLNTTQQVGWGLRRASGLWSEEGPTCGRATPSNRPEGVPHATSLRRVHCMVWSQRPWGSL